MTHPFTPREKVENALYSMEDWRHASPEYLIENILTALASSGDHAELARLAEEVKRTSFWREARDARDYVIDESCDADDYGAEERPVYAEWVRQSVLALLAENAALRAENERLSYETDDATLAALQSRATEAERKLAEAVGLLRSAQILREEMGLIPEPDSLAAREDAFLSKEAERG